MRSPRSPRYPLRRRDEEAPIPFLSLDNQSESDSTISPQLRSDPTRSARFQPASVADEEQEVSHEDDQGSEDDESEEDEKEEDWEDEEDEPSEEEIREVEDLEELEGYHDPLLCTEEQTQTEAADLAFTTPQPAPPPPASLPAAPSATRHPTDLESARESRHRPGDRISFHSPSTVDFAIDFFTWLLVAFVVKSIRANDPQSACDNVLVDACATAFGLPFVLTSLCKWFVSNFMPYAATTRRDLLFHHGFKTHFVTLPVYFALILIYGSDRACPAAL